MRPGLRESIEPSGADGGNVGADAGGRTRSSAINWPISLEFVCLETLCAPKRTDSIYSGHVSGWDRPPVDPLNAHNPCWRVRGHAITIGGTSGQKSEFRIRFRRGARLAGGNRPLEGRRGMEPRGRKPSARVYP
eukprot:scaffold23774_cov51-Phaeocystis_antarctica.AAC.3